MSTLTTTTVLNASPTGHSVDIFAEINRSLLGEVGYVTVDVESFSGSEPYEKEWLRRSTQPRTRPCDWIFTSVYDR
jgi:hypothetical protein